MKKILKRDLCMILVLAVLFQLVCVNAFAAGTSPKEPVYKNFVIYGDSLCLGFSTEEASMGDVNTYDIEANLLRAAQSSDYKHCYPTVFANRVGIDTFSDIDYAAGEKWNFRSETEWNDVYNFGICAAWTKDILALLKDPYYLYDYSAANYTKDDTFILPDDYHGIRNVVNTEAAGYNVADPTTWVYLTGEEYIDHYEDVFDWWSGSMISVPVYKTEEYTIPAGTAIPVAFEQDLWGMGTPMLVLNSIISEKYFFVSEKCLDAEGHFIDLNEDGVVDNMDILYYPAVLGHGIWGQQYVPNTAEYGATLGKAIQNPQFTKYYYDLATTSAKEGDLIALAMGNNDIYHSFMPYQQSSDSMLCKLMYWLTYALQMNYTVGQIQDMFNDPMWQNMIFGGFTSHGGQGNAESLAATPGNSVEDEVLPGNDEPADGALPGDGVGEMPAANEPETGTPDPEPPAQDDPAPGLPNDPDPGAPVLDFSSLISVDEINALMDLYSAENVTAYLHDTVEDYKVNYEETIKRVLELKQKRSELILIGHFNPFGLVNYMTMLSEAAQNGQLFEHLTEDFGVVGTLLQAIIGTPDQWGRINDMTEAELIDFTENANNEMNGFISALGALDLSDPDFDRALTNLIVDLSFPVSVLLVGNALADTYENMNNFLKEMAEKYDLAYVDVSDAPSSGRYDPHPTKYGHAWIADRLYETVVPEITSSISMASTGTGVLTPLGNKEFRLRDSQTYRFLAKDGSEISAIFVDGKLLDKDEFSAVYADGKYTFDKIMSSHCITVQFDRDTSGIRKYAVNVLGSYAKYGAGEGMYKPGDTVNVSAGALEGFEFTGWLIDGIELEDTTATNVTFTMPENEVTLTATWKVVEDDPEPTPPQVIVITKPDTTYDLTFETNGGSSIPAYTKKSGTVVDLDAFFTAKEGYTFGGWYLDKELKEPVSSVTLNRNITVYAKWNDPAPFVLPFTDVKENDWFYDDVVFAFRKGLMFGTSATTFSPNITTSRSMIVTILYRLEGKPLLNSECPFDDVQEGTFYHHSVTWAAENKIVLGYGDGNFGPDDNITREQLAAILYRYAQYKGYDVSARSDLSVFTDAGKISDYAKDCISWAYSVGLVKGVTDKTLEPGGDATRAQAAAVLHRFCDKYVN